MKYTDGINALTGFFRLPLEELDELSREMSEMSELEQYGIFFGFDGDVPYWDK